jgi:hypothetical protein
MQRNKPMQTQRLTYLMQRNVGQTMLNGVVYMGKVSWEKKFWQKPMSLRVTMSWTLPMNGSAKQQLWERVIVLFGIEPHRALVLFGIEPHRALVLLGIGCDN